PELLAHPEALRFLAPLLPSRTAERVLEVITADLSAGASLVETQRPNAETAALAAPHDPRSPDPSAPTAAIEKILAPLAKPAAPEPSPDSRKPTPADVDHERLAELTKPTPRT